MHIATAICLMIVTAVLFALMRYAAVTSERVRMVRGLESQVDRLMVDIETARKNKDGEALVKISGKIEMVSAIAKLLMDNKIRL